MAEFENSDLFQVLDKIPINTEKELALLVMGSLSDNVHTEKIAAELWDKFRISSLTGVYSAHKNTEELLELIAVANPLKRLVYCAIAGGSNALVGVLSAHTTHPVITCPPYSEPPSAVDLADLYSSVRMPSGIGSMFVMGAKPAAWAIASIFANGNPKIAKLLSLAQNIAYEKNITDGIDLVQTQLGLERVQKFLEI